MAYFKTIRTQGTDVAIVTREHNEKLNNYLKYGNDVPDSQYVKLNELYRKADHKEPEVEQMNSTMLINNFEYILTTILCCEDKAELEEED